MFIKRLLSAVTAFCMSISMLSAMTVNAAEKTLAPWSVYFAERTNNDNFASWVAAPGQYTTSGYFYISAATGTTNSEVVLATQNSGEIFMRTAADKSGYNGIYGAPAIGFTAPAGGSYRIDFTGRQRPEQPYSAANLATVTFGAVEGDTVNVSDSATIHGINVTETDTIKKETVFSTTVDLKAGELYTAKFSSTADGYLRMFYITYKVTDLSTGITYDFNDIGRGFNAPVSDTKNVYNIGDYNHSQAADHSMWSIHLAPDAEADTWNDMSTWVEYPIEDYRNADTQAIVIQKGTTSLNIYDSRPGGWFAWRPAGDGESGGTGTAIIGWTAPEEGIYAIDFGLYNMGNGAVKGDYTEHKLAYLKEGETTPELIERFTMPGAKENKEGQKKFQLKIDKGETIYLLNDSDIDGYGDNAIIRYEITNVNDPSKTWSASDMGKSTELTDSPFSLWTSAHTNANVTNNIVNYNSAVLTYQADTGRVVTNRWQVPYFMIKEDGTFETIPSGTANNAVMFDVPADGFYRVDFNATNTNTEETDVENAYAALYKVSGRTTDIGNALAKSAAIKKNGVYSGFSHIVGVSRGDKLVLNVNTNTDAWMLRLGGTYEITKLGMFNYTYTQDGVKIKSADELIPGATLTAKLDYVNEEAVQNLMVLVGAFNKDGTMISIGLSDEVTAAAGTPATISASIPVPEDVEGVTFKTFVVDGINSLVAVDAPNVLE